MVLVLDNYDSFTYNLVQYLGELGAAVTVVRNDAEGVPRSKRRRPERIVISPGPGRPEDAGVTMDVIRQLGPNDADPRRVPGASGDRRRVRRVGRSRLGPDARQDIDDRAQRPRRVQRPDRAVSRVALSLAGRLGGQPAGDLEVTARTREDGTIMGLRHRTCPVHGVQFHPESILTSEGRRILRNFLENRLD